MGNSNSNSNSEKKEENMNGDTNMNGNKKWKSEPREVPTITIESSLEEKELFATEQLMKELHENQYQQICKTEPEVMLDNSAFEYTYEGLTLPKDEEGYVKTFSVDEEEEFLAFFKKYGIVVIRDILTPEECKKSEDEIWEFIERHSSVKRNDPRTYNMWPALRQLGILGNDVILSKQMCENRQNEKLYKVFTKILGDERLFAGVGRASAMRPTKNIRMPKEGADGKLEYEIVDKAEWKTISEWLHWDMVPWNGKTTTFAFKNVDDSKNIGYDLVKVQSILAAVDCGPEDGGFHCVPFSRDQIRGWANKNKDYFKPGSRDTTVQIPEDDKLRNYIQTCPIRKGSLLIWDSCLPHGTFPNNSDHGRMIQYIYMSSRKDESITTLFDNPACLPPDFTLTELGKKLYGFEQWK